MKRKPAKARGPENCNPILTPTNAVDHNRQAVTASSAVLEKGFRFKRILLLETDAVRPF
jgi:hypothetical protein